MTSPLLVGQAVNPTVNDRVTENSDGRLGIGGIDWLLPKGWEIRAPSGSMRAGELVLPDHGVVAIFRFANGGGSAESNLERWQSQFSRHDTSWSTVDRSVGFPIHLTWIEGDLQTDRGPHGGMPPSENSQHKVLVGALLLAPKGLVVFKFLGSVAEARAMLPSFRRMLTSVAQSP